MFGYCQWSDVHADYYVVRHYLGDNVMGKMGLEQGKRSNKHPGDASISTLTE